MKVLDYTLEENKKEVLTSYRLVLDGKEYLSVVDNSLMKSKEYRQKLKDNIRQFIISNLKNIWHVEQQKM